MSPLFHAEQIGSLMRPVDLLAVRSAAGTSTYSVLTETELQKATEDAITNVVKKQLELGIRLITSGEYERDKFYSGFFEHLEGMEVVKDIPLDQGYRTNFPTLRTLKSLGIGTRDSVVATGKIRHTHSAYLSEWEALCRLLPEDKWKECKLTMPPVTHIHMQMAVGSAYKSSAYKSSAYASDKEYFEDLAAAYRAEFQTLYDAGLRSIQIDDPCLTYFVTNEFRSGCVADDIDPDELLDKYIWAHNHCLAEKPADLHIGLHLCRVNMAGSTHIISGSYERISKKMFTELAYDTYYLEYDTDRAGDFEPLRHLPIGKNVVLGVVSTKTTELEGLDELMQRVNSAAEVISRGQGREVSEVIADSLGVSPQCGFASMSLGGGPRDDHGGHVGKASPGQATC
ncbi:hypothetical protein N7532_000943 [Penicillium argentinense]|uniref:Cobalamin-independent methionine synthase MetE C-terminal/archaeal domain-containing protein n=1 Tax=Penicillium argentinense TaxID=1131581 RepID=A0A9W9G1K7_9EURO|nr:uncharacterized protein N7532_000943 [Penicillium argentinense]KAJ5110408.1 hypothetical protein N7532_000943 [Penicillium argentinense]